MPFVRRRQRDTAAAAAAVAAASTKQQSPCCLKFPGCRQECLECQAKSDLKGRGDCIWKGLHHTNSQSQTTFRASHDPLSLRYGRCPPHGAEWWLPEQASRIHGRTLSLEATTGFGRVCASCSLVGDSSEFEIKISTRDRGRASIVGDANCSWVVDRPGVPGSEWKPRANHSACRVDGLVPAHAGRTKGDLAWRAISRFSYLAPRLKGRVSCCVAGPGLSVWSSSWMTFRMHSVDQARQRNGTARIRRRHAITTSSNRRMRQQSLERGPIQARVSLCGWKSMAGEGLGESHRIRASCII